MNREIKYRAYIKNDYKKELIGKILDVSSIHLKTKKVIIGYSLNRDNYGNKSFSFDDIELMQYTGLHDKNGQEIYEGDIVLYQDWEMAYEGGGNDSFINKGIVEYCEDNCCFNVTERQTVDLADVLYKGNEDLEVIGNIYENPELLGGE